MRLYDITLFCGGREKSVSPLVSVQYSDKDSPWPVTISINSSGIFHKSPSITLHMTESDWINFKNSVLECDRQLTAKILGREHYE